MFPISALALVLAMPAQSPEIRHPFLVTNSAGLDLARKRVRDEDAARPILDRLRERADALEKEPLPVFEKEWWVESSKKHWTQTYPEINYHTGSVPAPAAVNAYHAALAYALTGEARYAELVRKTLLHYTSYEFFAEHPDVGLNWSVWCYRALCAYDLTCFDGAQRFDQARHGVYSPEDRARIDDLFRRAMEAIRKDDQWWLVENPGGLFNNHFAWHKLFIGCYGLFYGKSDLVEYAIDSDQGIRDLIEHGIRDDGLWFESSLNYHWTAVEPLGRFAQAMANAGKGDFWNRRFANGRCLKELFTGPVSVLFPDETLPMIGDTYGRRLKLGDVASYWPACDAYGSPEIAWLLRESSPTAESLFLARRPSPKPTPPDMRTRTWPEHGYVALRTQEGCDYWRGDGWSVFLSRDLDSVHSNRDKFDLIVYGRGAHVAVDAEATGSEKHAFSARVQGELNRSTICHNTVMVDGKDHNCTAALLDLVDFVDGPEVKLATVGDANGLVCPGVRMARTVAATPEYVLDVFQVASDEEHTYAYLFHGVADSGTFESEGSFESVDLGSDPPCKWLKGARRAERDGDWDVTARQGDLTARLTMRGDPGTRVTLCEFPRNDRFDPPPVPMLMAERRAKATTFVSVLQAEREQIADVKVELRKTSHGYLRVIVTRGGPREFVIRHLK